MNLWFSGLLLVAGLFLSSSAQTVQECKPLVTPLPTFKPFCTMQIHDIKYLGLRYFPLRLKCSDVYPFSTSYGRWIFIMGWITTEPFRELFKTTQSQWIEFIQTSPDHKEFVQDIGIRHTTYCKYGSHPVTVHSNLAATDKSNFTCAYHSLPTCEGCLLYTVDSRNNNNLIHIMNITEPTTIAEVEGYRAFYLMAKKNHVKHHELVHAMKQARCLGFTGEPDFIYDPKDTLCEKHQD